MTIMPIMSSTHDYRISGLVTASQERQISALEGKIAGLWKKVAEADPNDHNLIDRYSLKAARTMDKLARLKADCLPSTDATTSEMRTTILQEQNTVKLAENALESLIQGKKPDIDAMNQSIADLQNKLDTTDQKSIYLLEQLVLLEHCRCEYLSSQGESPERTEAEVQLILHRSELAELQGMIKKEKIVAAYPTAEENPPINGQRIELKRYAEAPRKGALTNCSDRLKATKQLQREVSAYTKLLEEGVTKLEATSELKPKVEAYCTHLKEFEAQLNKEIIELEEFYTECADSLSVSPSFVSSVKTRLSAALNAGLDRLIDFLGLKEKDYAWKQMPWARLLVEEDSKKKYLFRGFETAVDSYKGRIHKERDHIDQLEAKISFLKRNPDTGNLEATKAAIVKLEESVEEAKHNITLLKLYMRGTTVQRLIDLIGERQRAKQKLEKSIKDLEAWVEESGAWQTSLDDSKKQLERLNEEIAALQDGYNIQMAKYAALERPARSIGNLLADYTIDTIKDVLTLGYLRDTYMSPENLHYRKRLADAGYNMADALQILSKKGETMNELIKRHITGFLKWAKEHPEEARHLYLDVGMSVCIFANEEVLDLLIAGMAELFEEEKKKLDSSPKAGQDVPQEERPLTTDDLTYQALADLAKYAPIGLVAKRTVQELMSVWEKEGFDSAVVAGLRVALFEGTNYRMLQRLREAIPTI